MTGKRKAATLGTGRLKQEEVQGKPRCEGRGLTKMKVHEKPRRSRLSYNQLKCNWRHGRMTLIGEKKE